MTHRTLTLTFFVITIVLSGPALPAEPQTACQVGLTKQLFIDDYIIDEIIGAKKVLNESERHPNNPIIIPEHPWEGRVVVSPTVFWDEDQGCFRMYYWACYDKDDRIFTCYATSEDGTTWHKPMLGLHEGPDGTKHNNIVLRGEGRQARTRYVTLNPYGRTPEQKYVMMYIDNVPNLTEFAAYSPDGIHWTTTTKIGDLRDTTGGPPSRNPKFFLVEQKWDTSKHDHRYRAIWRTESQDLQTWTGGKWAVQLSPDDDPNLEFYHAASHFLGTQTYHGLHLGYLYPYHTEPTGEKLPDGVRMAGTIDVELMTSRDTVDWKRVIPNKPFLSLGKTGDWDAGMVFLSPEVVLEEEIHFYYGGYELEHSAENNSGAIGLSKLRADGFVHIEAEKEKAVLTTKPFEVTGAELHVNADCERGSIQLEILSRDGQPISGFTVEQCRPIESDGLKQIVKWNEELSILSGRTVRLRFHLHGEAKLYAFQFSNGG